MAQNDGPSHSAAVELLTQKEYANQKGWSKQYVNQLVKKGRIPLQGGKINPAVADVALARDRDPAQDPAFKTAPITSEPPLGVAFQLDPASNHGSFSKARTVREHFRALRERLEYEQQAGKLIPLEQVETAYFEAARDFRDAFQAAAVRIGQTLAGKFNLEEEEVVTITADEITTTLTELSRRFEEKCSVHEERVLPNAEN